MSEKKEPMFRFVTAKTAQNEAEQETVEEPVKKEIVFNQNITDDEIKTALDSGKEEFDKGKRMMIAGIVVALISVFMTSFMKVILMVGGVVLACFGFAKKIKAKKDVKMDAGIHVIHNAMTEVFDEVNYQPDKGLDLYDVADVQMGFPFSFNEVESDDLVEGIYHGLKIRMGDVKLNYVTTSTDEDGNEHSRTETVFKGIWLICDFGKELTADMTISEGIHTKKNRIKTDNEKFNKKFGVYSLNPHDVFYILTPHMMEYILQMDKRCGGDTYMNFSREGKLTIAINTGHETFEIDSFNMSAAQMREKFVNEVRYITDLLDELKLVDTMYKN